MFQENQKIGQYKLVKKLGKGGFGEVWLAKKRSLFITREFAIKLPLDDQIDIDEISHEAELWEKASGHPNVLPIIDADIYDGQIAIISEYVDGGSLYDKLQNESKLSLKESVKTITGILKGLEYLHNKGIIHRDLKPQNILLQGDTPRITDFGISRAINSSTSNVIGTPSYMAPEAFDGHRTVQTDIWAIGIIIYRMLFGELPFPQNDYPSLIKAILYDKPKDFPFRLPVTIHKMLNKTLAKNSKDRYQNVSEILDELTSPVMDFFLMIEYANEKKDIENHKKIIAGTDKEPRQQHYYFAHQHLHELTSRNPKIFIMETLESDRLNFEWVKAAKFSKPPDEEYIPNQGLASFPIFFSDVFSGVLIRFPQPKRIVEAYFVAIIINDIENKQDRKFQYITLEVGNKKNGIARTIIGSWTLEGSHINYGTGPDPYPQLFLDEVEKKFVR